MLQEGLKTIVNGPQNYDQRLVRLLMCQFKGIGALFFFRFLGTDVAAAKFH